MVGNLETERDFIAVEDAVDAYVRLAQYGEKGEIYNVCSGVPRKTRAIAEEILSLAPKPLNLRSNPELERPHDIFKVYGSWKKAYDAVGFNPRLNVSDSLKAAWYYELERTS